MLTPSGRTMAERKFLVEDSNYLELSPLLNEAVNQLPEDADKFDYLMAFCISYMAQNNYRETKLYDARTGTWDAKVRITVDWKRPGTRIYDVSLALIAKNSYSLRCTLIGIPVGDWMVLNLVPKGTSPACRTQSMTVNVVKYVNLHQTELGKFWHLKELASNLRAELLLPVHTEMLMEVGVESPCLQGIPESVLQTIVSFLDKKSKRNCETALKKNV